jgi:PhnB protein
MIELAPYLNFNGNCEEAMKFYQSVLGGELEINRFSEYADPNAEAPASQPPEGVMHATLRSDDVSFMASDGMPERAVNFGDNVHISVAGDDEAKLTEFFNGLSAGGTVDVPLSKQVWGDTFGMFTDKYGFHWMINITGAKS